MHKVIIVGASNIVKMAQLASQSDLQEIGANNVINLAIGGFRFGDENKVKNMVQGFDGKSIDEGDFLIIEFLSNSMLVGGPLEPKYWRHNGISHYCYVNPPRLINEHGLQELLTNINRVVSRFPQTTRIVVLPPPPRYLSGPCCGDEAHFKNHPHVSGKFLSVAHARVNFLCAQLRKTFRNLEMVSHLDVANVTSPTEAHQVLSSFEGTDRIHLNAAGTRAYWRAAMTALRRLSMKVDWMKRKPHFPPLRPFIASDEDPSQKGYTGGDGRHPNPCLSNSLSGWNHY